MNSLLGVDLPTPVNFVIAFVVVLLLIGAATWLVRRFGVTRLDAGARTRQPRLAVIDAAAVDGRRKLVIIRRDNIEHLLMIGGPTDVVVETNIVRTAGAEPATRRRRAMAPRLRSARQRPSRRRGNPSLHPRRPPPCVPNATAPRGRRRHLAHHGRADRFACGAGAARHPRPARQPRAAGSRRAARRHARQASLMTWSRPSAEPQSASQPAPAHAPMSVATAQQPGPAPIKASPKWRNDWKPRFVVRRRRRSLPKPPHPASRPLPKPKRPSVNSVSWSRRSLGAPRQPAAQPNNLEQEMASLLNKPGKT